jgi:hypothetical protein
VDGVPPSEVQATKQRFVAQVNSYVGRKKQADRELKTRLANAVPAADQGSTSANGGHYRGAAPGPSAQPQKQIRGMFRNNRSFVDCVWGKLRAVARDDSRSKQGKAGLANAVPAADQGSTSATGDHYGGAAPGRAQSHKSMFAACS